MDGLLQEGQAIVEFMVADIGGVDADLVQHLVGRVQVAGGQRFDLGYIVAQWIALQQIAVVEQQAVCCFSAGGLDQADRLGQAIFIGYPVLVVVVVQQVHMQIGGLHDAQLQLHRRSRCAQQAGAENQGGKQSAMADSHLGSCNRIYKVKEPAKLSLAGSFPGCQIRPLRPWQYRHIP